MITLLAPISKHFREPLAMLMLTYPLK
jgi:hypothetical protein